MDYRETLKLALSAIWGHKLRSFLTLLGMIIAVAAFMLVWSFLMGFKAYVDEKLAGIGTNSFTIRRFSFDDFKDTDTLAAAQRRNTELTFEELEFIEERSQYIDRIAAKALPNSREVKRGKEKLANIRIDGAQPEVAEIEKLDIAEGRYFTEAENNNAMRVAYVGSDISKKLFPEGGAIGGEITIMGIPYRIIGIQTTKGTVFGQPQDSFVQLPIKTYGSNFGGLTRSRGVYFIASAKPKIAFDDAVEEARFLMRIKRKLEYSEKDNFGILTPDAISKLVGSVTNTFGTVLLVVPTIALVVGAIVIMNIMLVAVTERKKEIGLRKALGARQSDILRQFLFESAILAAIGGIIGLGVAWLLGYIVTMLLLPTQISAVSAVLAIGVSALVGIVAGLFPAWQAANLDPIQALQSD